MTNLIEPNLQSLKTKSRKLEKVEHGRARSSTVVHALARSNTVKHGRNIPRAWLSSVKTYLKHGRNSSRARSKYNSSTVEAYLEHSRNRLRALSNHNSNTLETYLEYCQKKFEHGRNMKRICQEMNFCHFFCSKNCKTDANSKIVVDI